VNEPPDFNDPPQCNTSTPSPGLREHAALVPRERDRSRRGDTITLNVAGLPLGAIMTPALPTTTPSPVSSAFAWIPTRSQAGDYVVTFSATDSHDQQALCAVPIRVLDQCGDGDVDPGEQCDDGNTDAGDCCAPDCTFEPPGDPVPGTNACNQTYTVQRHRTCVGTNQVSCQPLDQCHDAGVCDTQTGLCTNPPKPDGTSVRRRRRVRRGRHVRRGRLPGRAVRRIRTTTASRRVRRRRGRSTSRSSRCGRQGDESRPCDGEGGLPARIRRATRSAPCRTASASRSAIGARRTSRSTRTTCVISTSHTRCAAT
jgi:cysteine-rich repeat protein